MLTKSQYFVSLLLVLRIDYRPSLIDMMMHMIMAVKMCILSFLH
jgi:hypothetical protein